MKFLKKCLRDIPSSLFFILGMCLTMTLIINVINVYTDINQRKEEVNKYSFRYGWRVRACPEKSLLTPTQEPDESQKYSFIDTSNTEKADEPPLKTIEEDGIILISYNQERFVQEVCDCLGEFTGNNYFEEACTSDKSCTFGGKRIFINRNEDIAFDLVDGNVENVKADDEKDGVYIPEIFRDDVYEDEGNNYIGLDGVRYKVSGVRKDYTLDLRDNAIYIYNVDEPLEYMKNYYVNSENVGYDGIQVDYDSNTDKTEEIKQICDRIKSYGYAVEMLQDSGNIELEIDSSTLISSVINILLIFFAIINCIFISAIWVTRRKSEIIIRKANGYSNLQLAKLLYFDLVKLMVVSLFTVVAGYGVASVISGENILYISKRIESIGLVFLCMVVVSVFTLCIPLIKVRAMQPATGIKEV